MDQLFPGFVDEAANRSLMEEILEEEPKEVLHTFQKDNSLGPDGWPIEFFLEMYDLIGLDPMCVVEESRSEGTMYAPFNSMFIALIPKTDDPQSL